MGEHELAHAGATCNFGGFARGAVSGLECARGFVVAEGGFVHEQVGVLCGDDGGGARARVAGHDNPASAPGCSDEVGRLDGASVVEHDGFALVNASPEGSFGDAHLAREIGVESSQAGFFDEGKSEAGGLAMVDGERFNVIVVPANERPWFQPLSYSLRCMVARQQQQASFWTIRPDTLEPLTLKAERDGSGQLPQTSGPALMASRMIIRLDGLMSALWSAEYWFRQGDNLFVHYRGIHGPPGTAETVISLEN